MTPLHYVCVDASAAQSLAAWTVHRGAARPLEIGTIAIIEIDTPHVSTDLVDLGAGVTVLRRTLPVAVASAARGPADGPMRAAFKIAAERLFSDHTVAQLIALAQSEGVDLTGISLKRELVAEIVRHRHPEWGGEVREKLADLQARIQAADPIEIARWAGRRGIDVTECASKAEAFAVISSALGFAL